MNKHWEKIMSLKTDKEMIDYVRSLPESELTDMRSSSNPFRLPVALDKDKFLVFSMMDFKRDFLEKLMIVAMKRFLYQIKNEFVPKSAYDYLSENSSEFCQVHRQKTAKALEKKIKATLTGDEQLLHLFTLYTRTMQPNKIKELREQNPELDFREVPTLLELNEDELSTIFNRTKTKLKTTITREEFIDSNAESLDEFLEFAFTDEFETRDKIPFKVKENFDRFFKSRYDELMEEADKQFVEKRDLEYAILPMKVCTSEHEYRNFVDRYKEEFDNCGDINVVKFGMYTIISPIKQNQERLSFYEQQPNILKDLIEHNMKYTKMANDLHQFRRMKKGRSDNLPKELEDCLNVMGHGDSTMKSFEDLKESLKPVLNANENDVDVPFHIIKPELRPNKPITRGTSSRYVMRL